MKQLFAFALVFASFCFVSCDKVKDPIVKPVTVKGSDFVSRNNSGVSGFRKFLLEDYTGARCPNCPDAAVVASNLHDRYKDTIVVIAVHAGNFAVPFGKWKNQDFRTNAGDVWNSNTGFSIPAYPNGMINRKNYANNGQVLLQTKWTSVASLAVAEPLVVKLDVTTNYDTVVGALNVDVKATFKKVHNNNVFVSVNLIEDGIVGLQDNRGVEIEDYDFEHMLRGAVNGEWGSAIKGIPISVNDSARVSFNDFNLKGLAYTVASPPATKPITVNDKNVSVVVFAYDAVNREVLQVEKVKIR